MFFLDVQGTLISDHDKPLIHGAKELIGFLNAKNLPYLIITNNMKKLDFLEKLRQRGLAIKENAYISPFSVLKHLLRPCKAAAFGADEFVKGPENPGFELDFVNSSAVFVASYDDFKFKDFVTMIELARREVRFIVMHETNIHKKDGGPYPGVDSIMAMLKNAIDFEYEVVGKPSIAFYKEALDLIRRQNSKIDFEDIKIANDDFRGDLLKAKELGMKALLVLSEKISGTEGPDTNLLDGVYSSVLEILEDLKCQV